MIETGVAGSIGVYKRLERHAVYTPHKALYGVAPPDRMRLSVDGYINGSSIWAGNGGGIKTAIMRKHNGKNRMEGIIDG